MVMEQFEIIDRSFVKQKVYEQFQNTLNKLEKKYLA